MHAHLQLPLVDLFIDLPLVFVSFTKKFIAKIAAYLDYSLCTSHCLNSLG